MRGIRELVKSQRDPRLDQMLQSLFLAEALEPSAWIYIVSPWTRNIPVLDNRSGGFQWLDEDWPMGWVHLLDWVGTVVERGAHVTFVETESSQDASREFRQQVDRLRDRLGGGVPGKLDTRTTGSLHEPGGNHMKGIFTQLFALTGSMNVSIPGMTMHTEHLTLRLSHDDAYQQLIPQVHQHWGAEHA